MAAHTTCAHRLLLAGGFAVAAVAAPLLIAAATPAGPPAPALAECPPNETVDPSSGACRPNTDQVLPTFNPVDPGITGVRPGGVTSSQSGEVGRLPEVNGIPCNGQNTGLCIGLQQSQGGGGQVPNVTTGGFPHTATAANPTG